MMTIRPTIVRLLAPLIVLAVLLTACNTGMPDQSGEYQLQAKSLTYDGQQYRFAWIDKGGAVRWASGDDVQLVQGDRTYLEMKDGHPIVHLTSDEPVTVLGRDNRGDFQSSWFPFLAGAAVGNALGGRDRTVVINQPYPGTSQVPPNRPAYRYPPTDSFGRGDSLAGSVTNTRPSAPDYRVVSPRIDAASGASGGTGTGSAASNKAPSYSSGAAGGAGSGLSATSKSTGAVSGAAGGTGSGTAAGSKGSFSSGGKAPSIGGGASGGSKAPSIGGSKAPKVGGGRVGGRR